MSRISSIIDGVIGLLIRLAPLFRVLADTGEKYAAEREAQQVQVVSIADGS